MINKARAGSTRWIQAITFNRTFLFVITFLAVLVILLAYPGKVLFGDSQGYINLAYSFERDGKFSLLNYNNPLRGYMLPLLLYPITVFQRALGADVLLVFRVVNAFFFAGLVVLITHFFERIFGFRARFWQNAVLAGLLLFFWYGHMAFPLSDFPALALGLSAVLMGWTALEKAERPLWQRLLFSFSSGVLLAASVMVRTSYQFSMYVAVLLFIIGLFLLRIPAVQRTSMLAVLVIGAVMIFTPQFLMNSIHHNTPTPFSLNNYQGKNLFLFQLHTGMFLQRADFGYQDENGNSTYSAIIPDNQGSIIKQRFYPEMTDNFTLRSYLGLIRRFPLDFATMYARHLFNGLDVVYPTVYNHNVLDQKLIYRLLNYTLWFVAGWTIFHCDIVIKRDIRKLAVLGVIAMPALSTIPGAIENRFFLPIFVMMYACVCYMFFFPTRQWKDFISWRTAVLYSLFLAGFFIISAGNFALADILLTN